MSLSLLTALSALLHAWVGWRLAPALAPFPGVSAALGVLLVLSALLMPAGLLARRLGRHPLATLAAWAALLCMGLFSTLLVLTLVRDAVLVAALGVALVAGLAGARWWSLEPLVTWTAAAVPLAALLATAWGFWNARRTASVVRVDVPIAGLPETLHGFSIAQVSDIHVGPTIGQAYLQRIVDRVNALQADIVAITGDLVDGHVDELRDKLAPLRQLVSTHGSFFVTGNHEYYSGAHAWIAELRTLGVQVLLNEHRVLHHEAASEALPDGVALQRDTEMVVVAGVADFGAHHFDASHRSDPHAAIRGAPAGARFRLLLAHQPRSAQAAIGAGYHLQLSGHTHGGQFWPWMHFVRFQQPFTAGLRRLEDQWVYTNRGTGYWGPPKRFGVASEITYLRLVPG